MQNSNVFNRYNKPDFSMYAGAPKKVYKPKKSAPKKSLPDRLKGQSKTLERRASSSIETKPTKNGSTVVQKIAPEKIPCKPEIQSNEPLNPLVSPNSPDMMIDLQAFIHDKVNEILAPYLKKVSNVSLIIYKFSKTLNNIIFFKGSSFQSDIICFKKVSS